MMHKVRVLDLYYSSLFPLYWTYRQVKYCFALVLGSVIRHCTHNVLFVLDPCLAGHGRFYALSPNEWAACVACHSTRSPKLFVCI